VHAASPLLVGVFVGGRASRMGGIAKGLLTAPQTSETLVERLLRVSREALGAQESLLVGRASAYAELGLAFVEDSPPGVGPLGGLAALLETAVTRGHGAVIALACDLPHVSAGLIARLAAHAPAALAVAPRPDGVWQPLVARYEPRSALEAARSALAAGDRALYRVLDRLGSGAVELALSAEEAAQLRDWDEPGDLEASD
jgi:molybdopterin-guanine dinucleotide biosynthesis protein A